MSRWRPGNVLRDFAIDERTAVRRLTLSAGAAVLVVCLAACGSDDPDPAGIKAGSPEGQKAVAEGTGTGTDTTGRLVESSPIAVVAAPDPASQALAASAAVGMRAPMLTAVAGHDDDVKNELERMKVSRVLRVGGATVPDGIEAVDAPSDREGLQKVTGVTFHDEPAYPSDFVDDVIVLQTLLWPDEVRDSSQLDHLDEVSEPKEAEVAMARMLVDSMSGDFEPEGHVDDFKQAVDALVQSKIEGGDVTESPDQEEEADSGEVVDLLAALQRSVDRAKAGRGQGPADEEETGSPSARSAGTRTTAKKTTAKKTAATKTAAKKKPARTTAKKTTTRKKAG